MLKDEGTKKEPGTLGGEHPGSFHQSASESYRWHFCILNPRSLNPSAFGALGDTVAAPSRAGQCMSGVRRRSAFPSNSPAAVGASHAPDEQRDLLMGCVNKAAMGRKGHCCPTVAF